MSNPSNTPDAEFVDQALKRLNRINRAAAAATEALGLPPEAKYSVMAIQQAPASDSTISGQVQNQEPGKAALESAVKADTERLVLSFLEAQLPWEVANFEAIWASLRAQPLEALRAQLAQTQTGFMGILPYSERMHTLAAVLTVSLWAVEHRSSQGTRHLDWPSTDEIYRQAVSRGCDPALSRSLAQHIEANR